MSIDYKGASLRTKLNGLTVITIVGLCILVVIVLMGEKRRYNDHRARGRRHAGTEVLVSAQTDYG